METFMAAIWAVILALGGYNPAEVEDKNPTGFVEYEKAKQIVFDGNQGDFIDAS